MVCGVRNPELNSFDDVENIPLTTTHFRNIPFSTYPEPSCDGGHYFTAFGGVTCNSSYPNDVTARKCDVKKNDYFIAATGYHRVGGRQNMINHILNGGTLVITLDASGFSPYKSGIFFTWPAPPPTANHGIQTIGVNVDEGYWIVPNSWGDWWGDQGYIKIALVYA